MIKKTMDIIRDVADSVIDMVDWTRDCVSMNASKKLPVIDFEIFFYKKDGKHQIAHQFYSKPMSNMNLISMK